MGGMWDAYSSNCANRHYILRCRECHHLQDIGISWDGISGATSKCLPNSTLKDVISCSVLLYLSSRSCSPFSPFFTFLPFLPLAPPAFFGFVLILTRAESIICILITPYPNRLTYYFPRAVFQYIIHCVVSASVYLI